MISMIRWVAATLFLVIMAVLSRADHPTATTAALAVAGLALFLVVAWTCGAFRREAWIGDAPDSEPPSRLDVLDGRARR